MTSFPWYYNRRFIKTSSCTGYRSLISTIRHFYNKDLSRFVRIVIVYQEIIFIFVIFFLFFFVRFFFLHSFYLYVSSFTVIYLFTITFHIIVYNNNIIHYYYHHHYYLCIIILIIVIIIVNHFAITIERRSYSWNITNQQGTQNVHRKGIFDYFRKKTKKNERKEGKKKDHRNKTCYNTIRNRSVTIVTFSNNNNDQIFILFILSYDKIE